MKVKILVICKFGFAGILLLLAGCATMPSPPQYEATHYSMHQESKGFKVSVEPFSDKENVKKYFGVDLISRGIFPLYVRIVNGTESTSILVGENTFLLKIRTNIKSKSQSHELVDTSNAVGIQMAGAILISTPLSLIGTKLETDARKS